MKKYIVIIALSLSQFTSFSQDLISKYKTGVVKLVPDEGYALGNDWETVFRSYYDTLYSKPMGLRKSLVLLPDGSVIVNHAYKNYHTKFSPSGKFEKEFVLEKAGHKAVEGVINGNTLFTGLDNIGKMTCTDFDGKFKKTLTLDYMARNIVALSNGKFAVVGWVIWAEKFRTFVSIVDYETNNEKIIWERFTDREFSIHGEKIKSCKPFSYTIRFKEGGMSSNSTMPYSQRISSGIPPQITTVNNELIIAVPNTGEILAYDFDGKMKYKSKIEWPNSTISIEEQKAIQQNAINRYKSYIEKGNERVTNNIDAYKQMLSEMEEDLENIKTPLGKPFFANLIKDSDGNVLFFEIPEEKGANVFHVWVYNQTGVFVTKCTFVCDEYDLNINSRKMVFKDGHIYGLQTLKNFEGNPLRLMRFKLETN